MEKGNRLKSGMWGRKWSKVQKRKWQTKNLKTELEINENKLELWHWRVSSLVFLLSTRLPASATAPTVLLYFILYLSANNNLVFSVSDRFVGSGVSLNPAETFLSLWFSKAHLSVGDTVTAAEYLSPQTPALASHSGTAPSAPDPPLLLLLLHFLNATAFLRQLIPPRLFSLPFVPSVAHVRLTLTLVCPGCFTDSSGLPGICDHSY